MDEDRKQDSRSLFAAMNHTYLYVYIYTNIWVFLMHYKKNTNSSLNDLDLNTDNKTFGILTTKQPSMLQGQKIFVEQ